VLLSPDDKKLVLRVGRTGVRVANLTPHEFSLAIIWMNKLFYWSSSNLSTIDLTKLGKQVLTEIEEKNGHTT
jgi:hypothetical protein